MIFQQKLSESSDNTDVWTATPAREVFAVSRSERWTENTVFHASSNPSPERRMAPGRLQVKAYGLRGQPHIVFKHKDIDRAPPCACNVKCIGRAMPGIVCRPPWAGLSFERVACRGIHAVLAAGRTGGRRNMREDRTHTG